MIYKAIIEMPRNTMHKYEIKDDRLILDRVLKIPVPANYGYIENTLAADGDPIDIFVISKEKIYPKTQVSVEIIGMFRCFDQGIPDDKIIGRLKGLTDDIFLGSIKAYLESYKEGFKVVDYTEDKSIIELEIIEALKNGARR